MAENTAIDSSVVTVAATDSDYGTDGSLTYSITAGNTNSEFVINPVTGEIRTAKSLDKETISTYTLTIKATDGGTDPSVKTATVTQVINILDASDIDITCTDYSHSISLAENHAVNSAVSFQPAHPK